MGGRPKCNDVEVLKCRASYLVALDKKGRKVSIGTVFEAEQVKGIE